MHAGGEVKGETALNAGDGVHTTTRRFHQVEV